MIIMTIGVDSGESCPGTCPQLIEKRLWVHKSVKSSILLLCKCQRKDRLHTRTNHSCHRRNYDLQRRYL